MKKYIFLIITLFAFGCEDYLDTQDYLSKNDQNFPESSTDVDQMLTGAYYSMMKVNLNSTYYIGALASDEQFGSGAANDADAHGFDRWLASNPNMAHNIWSNYYEGIYRVNKLLEAVGQVNWSSEEHKSRATGEAYFLRAFFYSELSKLFGEVPLLIKSDPVNIPQTPADETYAQIASDLQMAIDLLPSEQYNSDPAMYGHATKWAAQALLARVYLFYTGYYDQNNLPLPDGGSIEKSEVVQNLEDLITNSGHHLINDFRNLWAYTNELTKEDYAYTQGEGLQWAGENNAESVFAIHYTLINGWGDPRNVIAQAFGVRGQSNVNNVFPFGGVWGHGQINPRFVDSWVASAPEDEIRRWGSVLDVEHPREGIVKYETGGWNMVEETKLFPKKLTIIRAFTDKSAPNREDWLSFNINIIMDGMQQGFNNASIENLVLIRYADVLLMHSELTETKDNLNVVRDRAGLDPVAAYSLDHIKQERHHELAFEGIRFYDLLRWYGDDAGAIIDQSQNGAELLNDKVPGVFQANLTDRIKDTGGFMQIPEQEILLSGNVLKQNPGWTGPESILQ